MNKEMVFGVKHLRVYPGSFPKLALFYECTRGTERANSLDPHWYEMPKVEVDMIEQDFAAERRPSRRSKREVPKRLRIPVQMI